MWDVDAAGQKASAPVVSPAAAMTAGLLQLQEQALITRKARRPLGLALGLARSQALALALTLVLALTSALTRGL